MCGGFSSKVSGLKGTSSEKGSKMRASIRSKTPVLTDSIHSGVVQLKGAFSSASSSVVSFANRVLHGKEDGQDGGATDVEMDPPTQQQQAKPSQAEDVDNIDGDEFDDCEAEGRYEAEGHYEADKNHDSRTTTVQRFCADVEPSSHGQGLSPNNEGGGIYEALGTGVDPIAPMEENEEEAYENGAEVGPPIQELYDVGEELIDPCNDPASEVYDNGEDASAKPPSRVMSPLYSEENVAESSADETYLCPDGKQVQGQSDEEGGAEEIYEALD